MLVLVVEEEGEEEEEEEKEEEVTEVKLVSVSFGCCKKSKDIDMLLFPLFDGSVTRSSKSYIAVVIGIWWCVPVRVSMAVTPGKTAELVIALMMVAPDEKRNTSADLRAKVLMGDKVGHMLFLMQAAIRLPIAATHVPPGVMAFFIAVALATTVRWMTTLKV